MKKGKFFLIELPIYNIDLAISIGQDYNSFQKSIYGVWDIPKEDFIDDTAVLHGVSGAAVTCCRSRGKFFVPYAIKFESSLKDSNRHTTIAHEVFHCVYRILYSRGLELTYESEEAFAYLTGHITREIYKLIEK